MNPAPEAAMRLDRDLVPRRRLPRYGHLRGADAPGRSRRAAGRPCGSTGPGRSSPSAGSTGSAPATAAPSRSPASTATSRSSGSPAGAPPSSTRGRSRSPTRSAPQGGRAPTPAPASASSRWRRPSPPRSTSLGVDARVGEVAGEYCPGEFSVNARGAAKLAGIGQRVVVGGAHVGGVIVVRGAGRIREVLTPIYEALEIDWRAGDDGQRRRSSSARTTTPSRATSPTR